MLFILKMDLELLYTVCSRHQFLKIFQRPNYRLPLLKICFGSAPDLIVSKTNLTDPKLSAMQFCLLFCLFLLKFMMKQHIKKDLLFFLDLKVNLHFVLDKNKLRIILGSKSKIFENIEVRQKIRYSYKNCVLVTFNSF